MRLKNCNGDQDSILTDCESFGGRAAKAAEIAQDLDNQLSKANDQIADLENQVKEMKNNQ